MRETAQAFGEALRDKWSWQKGDVLGLFAANDVDYMPCLLGALYAGGIVSPASPAYTVDELAHMLADSKAKALVTQASALPIARAAAKIANIPESKIVLLGAERDSSFRHFVEMKALRRDEPRTRVNLDPWTDLAYLVYSSGTTGLPKGVMLTHVNIIANLLQIKHSVGHNYTWQDDRLLGCIPFFHTYGLTACLHQALHRGIELIVMPKFELDAFCAAVQRFKISIVYIAPPIAVQLSRGPSVQSYDLSSLKMMTCAAAPLTTELVRTVWQRLGIKTCQAYGMSEASPVTHLQSWEDWMKTMGSVGKLAPSISCIYVSEDGKELQPGESGELCVQGPNVFPGYWLNADATKTAFTPAGFYKTGDVGTQDHDGNLYISDRVKELIKYQGFQVAPAELESVLLECPLVQDVAVVGVDLPELHTEAPRAYVVPAAGYQPSEQLAEDINEWLSPRVAYYKRLRGGIRFIDAVPKSGSGKILRRILRDRAREEGTDARSNL